MNIYDRKETVNKNRLKHFQTLVQFSCAKIETDENLENINNNGNSNNQNNENNRRPLYGIIINRPREPTVQDHINRSRRYMVAREHIDIIAKPNKKKNINNNINEYTQTELNIKKFDVIKKEKKVCNIFLKAEYKKDNKVDKKLENKENSLLEINSKTNNNILNEPKMNPIININITSNNNVINKTKNNNPLLRSSATNFNNNKSIIKKEKIQIDAKKKEEDEKEINIKNNIKNTTGLKLHKSMERYGHLNNTKVKRGTYKLKSKGKLFKKSDK
jgi:hypothetical protein